MNLTPEQKATAKPMPMFIRELRDAIRAGRKTMTRRVEGFDYVNEEGREHWQNIGMSNDGKRPSLALFSNGKMEFEVRARYQTNDFCYLREPLERGADKKTIYRDDSHKVILNGIWMPWSWAKGSLSQMLMPRIAARTFCKITGVRVERLQEITEDDAKAEGVKPLPSFKDDSYAYRSGFCHVWDCINAKRGYGWESNPWTWIYEFELL